MNAREEGCGGCEGRGHTTPYIDDTDRRTDGPTDNGKNDGRTDRRTKGRREGWRVISCRHRRDYGITEGWFQGPRVMLSQFAKAPMQTGSSANES